jgi:PncC family amidohydrolase
MEKKIEKEIRNLMELLKRKNLFLATMESCTGGALINAITNIPGASEITRGGIVAYSTEQKIYFGVPKKKIDKYSVYSKEVAIEMAKIAQKKFKSQIGIGITGILSRKDPNYPEKEVGKVYFAIAFFKKIFHKEIEVKPQKNREKEKMMIVFEILKNLKEILK